MTEREKSELAKREKTKRNMLLVRRHYERLLTEYEAATNSRGMAAAWGRVGGLGNRIARPTQDRAMCAIALEERRKQLKGWFECIRGTYSRLSGREGKSPNLWRHQQLLARALQLYVFEQADCEMITMMMSGARRLSRQYVNRILNEAVNEVMADAGRAGLLEDDEAAGNEAG